MNQMNWGLIGPGSIAHTFADAISQSERGKLAAVASSSAERGQAFAKKYNIPTVYDNYQALISDPDIDIIYIATPHSFHYPQAKLCLEGGKNVLLEKPSTITAKQIERLTELAQQKGLFFQEAIWTRFMPVLAQVKEKIKQGAIGKVQYISSTIGFAFQHREETRLFDPKLGGGALLDLGLYPIAVSQCLLDEEPSVIQAMGKVSDKQIDETTIVNMRYPSGIYSQFTCSATGHSPNVMTIVGSNGNIVLPAMFWDTDTAHVYDLAGLVETIRVPHKVNGFEYQIEESMDCVEAGQLYSSLMSHDESIGIIEIMDEIRSQIGLAFSSDIEKL
ncbi:Gfo/Idh/MocA family oxidoreductase [Paraglaciecola aquimarina]|uniref:Gfo/Idh/MocA family oxidoreductase n=1 Tax=Paraglaciecola aquimarina TaxID=1235557 RepID=A0ABU3SXT6_9ALTE|nr:Gfo/Idh/MocA family oxidoreductase [Paraglaciecola aquimarina]MDU0354815.1 Gfo/Idh/MocA family oxidoreductase [Paraglaciecola aquimarina]